MPTDRRQQRYQKREGNQPKAEGGAGVFRRGGADTRSEHRHREEELPEKPLNFEEFQQTKQYKL